MRPQVQLGAIEVDEDRHRPVNYHLLADITGTDEIPDRFELHVIFGKYSQARLPDYAPRSAGGAEDELTLLVFNDGYRHGPVDIDAEVVLLDERVLGRLDDVAVVQLYIKLLK